MKANFIQIKLKYYVNNLTTIINLKITNISIKMP